MQEKLLLRQLSEQEGRDLKGKSIWMIKQSVLREISLIEQVSLFMYTVVLSDYFTATFFTKRDSRNSPLPLAVSFYSLVVSHKMHSHLNRGFI